MISIGANDLYSLGRNLHDGHVERTAAQVIDDDLPCLLCFSLIVSGYPHSVGNSCGNGLVHNGQYIEFCQFAGCFRGHAFGFIEIGRARDDDILYFVAAHFSAFHHVFKNEGRNGFGRMFLIQESFTPGCSHFTLDQVDKVIRIGIGGFLGTFPDDNTAIFKEDGGSCNGTAVRVIDDFNIAAVAHMGNGGIRGTQIDTVYFDFSVFAHNENMCDVMEWMAEEKVIIPLPVRRRLLFRGG